jgi:hypothetical protein
MDKVQIYCLIILVLSYMPTAIQAYRTGKNPHGTNSVLLVANILNNILFIPIIGRIFGWW